MIHQIILSWFQILRCTKIYSILFAHILHLLIRPRQPDDVLVKLREVFSQHLWSVARWIARNEDRKHDGSVVRLGTHNVNYGSHFIKLIRTYIRTVGEAEVQLKKEPKERYRC